MAILRVCSIRAWTKAYSGMTFEGAAKQAVIDYCEDRQIRFRADDSHTEDVQVTDAETGNSKRMVMKISTGVSWINPREGVDYKIANNVATKLDTVPA